MSSQPTAPRVIRFGLFELDLSTRELRKQDRNIKLQDQPFQVLALLLSRPCQIVTREELQQALWPADTFVEFDQGLNTAIKKIRLALGDAADHPRFIETVPRRGYRFIAPVAENAIPAVAAPAGPRRRRPLLWTLGVLGAVIIAAASAWFWSTQQAKPVATAVPLTSYPGGEWSPSFSPDGTRVAFVWSRPLGAGFEYRVYIKLIGTDEPVPLTRGPASEDSPAWSPDGRYIAFTRPLHDEKSGVFLIPAIGGAERKVAEVYTSGEPPLLAWHPGGKWLAVVDKETPEGPVAIFLLSIETSAKRRLTSPPRQIDGDKNPSFSPDGRVLAFCRMVVDSVGDLFLLELSADLSPVTQPQRLTFDNRYTASPAWAPDGRAIVFSAGTPHSPNLYEILLSRPGWRPGKPQRLPFASRGARQPAISRQGRLAYTVAQVEANIWRLDLNGARPVNLGARLIASTHLDHFPEYSPDGKRIAFASNRSGSHEIWVCNSDGSGTRQLTSFDNSYSADHPHWSPDGRQIAFEYRPEGRCEMFIVSSEGGVPKRIPTNFVRVNPNSWSHDGKWIYFDASNGGDSQVWKMPAGGGSPIQITREGGARARESPDGKFLFYLKNGDEMTSLWKVPVRGGEETQVLEPVCCENFAVVDRGIYFIPKLNSSVQFLDFATRKITTIANLSGFAAYGFSLSPDGRRLLYSQYENRGADLSLVENFR